MKYPFLTNNELILFDYLPGGSGQLLMRIWSELDIKLDYTNTKILSDIPMNSHKSSREIVYDILVPKRTTNWFLNQCEPSDINDYVQFFEFLGTHLLAMQQQGNTKLKFYDYEDSNYQMKNYSNHQMKNYRILYGIHSWDKTIPFKEMQDLGYKIRCISLIPKTEIANLYQRTRSKICYPMTDIFWHFSLKKFNNKPVTEYFDFYTLLSNKDTAAILSWLSTQLKEDFNADKISYATEILEAYYTEIVDNLYV